MSRHHAHMNTIGIDLTTRRHHPYGQCRLALDMTCGNHILQLWKDGLQWLQAFAATVVFLSNIGPVKLEPSSADFEILHMWDSPGPRLDIEIRGHFAPIPQKSFEYSPYIGTFAHFAVQSTKRALHWILEALISESPMDV